MKITIYKNQYGFSTLAKNGDTKIYIPIRFYDCEEPTEERVTIQIEDGFFSNYKDKNNLVKPKIMIKKYKEVEDIGVEQTTEYTTNPFGDDLPF